MGKRKTFVKTDISTPIIEYVRGPSNAVVISPDAIPPKSTLVKFGFSNGANRTFDFSPWYNVGIDSITYACQRQIERFLDKQDLEVEPTTVRKYCDGLTGFFRYLTVLCTAMRCGLTPNDLNRNMIDGYLGYLKDGGTSTVTQKSNYNATKSVLKALSRRGLIQEVQTGDDCTFPRNPFPGAQKQVTGERPLSRNERKAFSIAVKTAVLPIFSDDIEPTSHVLAYALLVVALHTGRNTSPLLEMTPECLRSHPKDETSFLVVFKRRGHSTSKVALRESLDRDLGIESMPSVRPTVARLIRRVMEISARLRADNAGKPRRRNTGYDAHPTYQTRL